MSLTKVSYSMIAGEVVNVLDYGAKGDGSTDDTVALETAFALTGKTVYLPAGTYKTIRKLVPTCAAIIGENQATTIIKPTSAVSRAMAISSPAYPQVLSSFKIDGANTTSAFGIFFGETDSCACSVNDIRVVNFTGSGAVGIRIGDMLKSQFSNVTIGGCTTGLVSLAVTSSFPTTVLFTNCVITDSTLRGAFISDGWTLTFLNCDFESSAEEGVLILPASGAVANNIVFESCWFEDNYTANTGQFQFTAGDGTSRGGAVINPIVRNCYFATTASTAKSIRMNGSAVYFVIDNPQLVSPVTGAISIENDAYGVLSNWVGSGGMTFDTVVSDSLNRCSNADNGAYRTWTPTFSDSASTGFTGAPTLTTHSYKFSGATIEVTLDWSATLAGSGTPSYIRCTVPTNLTPAANSTILGWVSINGTWQPGMMAASTDGYIYFRKIDNSTFAAGAALIFRGSLAYAH